MINIDMTKVSKTVFVSIVFVSMMSIGMGGHGVTPVENNNNDVPEPETLPVDKPSDVGPNSSNISIPVLPDQASDTAKQVLETIQNAFQNSIQGLGDALKNMFQGGG